jgi:hypothetical protein
MAKEQIKMVTPLFTIDFPMVFKPHVDRKTKEVKGYEITMIFKDVDVKPLIKLMQDTAKAKWGSDLDGVKWCLKKPNKKRLARLPHYEGAIYGTASTKFKPTVIDAAKADITDESQIYSGAKCFARVSARAWEHSDSGSRGVSFTLLALQKKEDGEKLFKEEDHTDHFDSFEETQADDSEFSFGDNDEDDITL